MKSGRLSGPRSKRGISEGLQLEGPLPTDTLMVRARDGHYDAVVAMFHDQGHIALKLLGMHRAVNITLGLPIIRTSVAHGTAFDIAWKRRAETGSMIEAIRIASRLAADREAWRRSAGVVLSNLSAFYMQIDNCNFIEQGLRQIVFPSDSKARLRASMHVFGPIILLRD